MADHKPSLPDRMTLECSRQPLWLEQRMSRVWLWLDLRPIPLAGFNALWYKHSAVTLYKRLPCMIAFGHEHSAVRQHLTAL